MAAQLPWSKPGRLSCGIQLLSRHVVHVGLCCIRQWMSGMFEWQQ